MVPPKNNYPNPEPQVDFGLGQGMPYLAGALKSAGHEVFGVNIYHRWCHGSVPLTLERMLQEAIDKYQPHLIGVGGLAPHYFFMRDAIFFCRKISADIPVVCGGGIVTYDPEYVFSSLRPDFAVMGEGEISLVKLAEYLEKGGSLESIPGLIYEKGGRIMVNGMHYPQDLDSLPYPDYAPFEYEAYLSLYNQMNNSFAYSRYRPRILPLTLGRSCPYRCTFCSKSSEYRTRSVDNAMKEIAHFHEKYRFNILYVTDELFSVKDGKAREFCAKIKRLKKELKADFGWSCHVRVSDVDMDILKEMKDAGCVFIGYGFESASNAVLKSMKKGITSEQILQAIRLTEEANIGIQANFIFGDTAETPETIEETVNFYNKHCKNHCVSFFYITPYPGSELFQYCLDRSLIPDRQKFYENIMHNRGSLNMTGMPNEVFYNLTKPVIDGQYYNCEVAAVVSCEKEDFETADRNAPFELRRDFYKISAVCPHCSNNVEYCYPLRFVQGKTTRVPVLHYCSKCHKKIILNISPAQVSSKPEEDPYLRFYSQTPYSGYYPFNSDNSTRQSSATPQLLESYKGYNIVRYAQMVYGIAQALGKLDIAELDPKKIDEYQKKGRWFTGSSVDEIKRFINGRQN